MSDTDVAAERIEAALDHPSIGAFEDGRLVGYLMASAPRPPGDGCSVKIAMHATTLEHRRDIYRALYARLAGELTAIGGFAHTVAVNSADRSTLDAWFELGFGVDQIRGVQRLPDRRPVSMPTPQGVQVREAQPDDQEHLVELAREVTRFHARSPILRPALSDHDAIGAGLVDNMSSASSLVVVAELGNEPVGFLQAHRDRHFLDTITIGIAGVAPGARHRGVGTVLVDHAMRWAGNAYSFCAVEWSSANPISDRFWRAGGFRPLQHKLTRRIDPRIAWAHPRISYDHIHPLEL